MRWRDRVTGLGRPGGALADAMAREEARGIRLLVAARTAALAVIGGWLCVSVPPPRVWYWLGLVALFALLGVAPLALRRLRRGAQSWAWFWTAVFVALDAALLTYAVLAPNPFLGEPWPPQMALRFHNVLFFFVFVAAAALSYSPLYVLWTGLAAAAAWSVGVWRIAGLPDSKAKTYGFLDQPGLTTEDELAIYLDPLYVSIRGWQNEIVLLLVASSLLALAVWRSQRLVRRQVAAETERSSLARYFSPNIVEEISRRGDDLSQVARHPVAVLFADIEGFAAIAETAEPERTIALLRSFHRRMAKTVFANGGTIDKYIGDCVMATFGTPRPGPHDALRALRCARAMVEEAERWNRKRAARGAFAVHVGVGLHWGEAVVANIGDDRRLELTVIGDVVNVASRVERLSRERGAKLVVSEAAIAAAAREGAEEEGLMDGLVGGGEAELRGRRASLAIRMLPRSTVQP